MANVTLKAKLVLRNDTESNWIKANPVLIKGEMGYCTDKQYLKIGDGTSGKTAVSAIQTLRLLARTYYNYTFSLQNVVRITEKELHTVLFNHSDHLFRQLLNVFTRNQRSFNHINTFSFRCRARSSQHLPCHVKHMFVAAIPFILYHSLSFLN